MFGRTTRRAVVVGAAGIGLLIGSAAPALASTGELFPNSNYGFDGTAHLIVGGGSTTLYPMMQNLSRLYMDTQTCVTNIAAYNAATPGSPQSTPAFNECETGTAATTAANPQPYSGGEAGGNFDGDTVAIAEPAGSSTGIASLNGDHGSTQATYAYGGANQNVATGTNTYTNGYGTLDFALSSRGPKTSGGNCPLNNSATNKSNDELLCDTFWGVAADGVDVFTFTSKSLPAGGYDTGATNSTGTGGFSATDLYNIWTCKTTEWGQLPEWQAVQKAYKAAHGGASDPALQPATAPIVPWSINGNSGTLGDFQKYIDTNVAAANNAFTPNTGCARYLNGNAQTSPQEPLENDVKPLITDAQGTAFTPPPASVFSAAGSTDPYGSTTSYAAGTSTDSMSPQNPANWLWFGSYGLLTEFPYLSAGTIKGFSFGVSSLPIATGADTTNGLLPSAADIGNGTYPIGRVLNVVTKKSDADCPVSNGICNFTANPGPANGNGVADLNVTGATGGPGGAVREFVRFLCRPTAATEPLDPYTGTSLLSEIQGAIADSGFEAIPVSETSPGSACDVQSVG